MSDRDTGEQVAVVDPSGAAAGARELGDLRRRMAELDEASASRLRQFQDEVDELRRDIIAREQAQEAVLSEIRELVRQRQRCDQGIEIHRSEAAVGGNRIEIIILLK